MLYAEDDTDIPAEHSVRLFRAAVRCIEVGVGGPTKVDGDAAGDVELLGRIEGCRQSCGEGGSATVWPTRKREIRLQLQKYGVHDKIMSYPATSLAVHRAFQGSGRQQSYVQ